MQKFTTCLWFDNEAEEAAQFYTSVFKNSKIAGMDNYGEATQEVTDKPPGSVMTVEFELEGQKFLALNGGPEFKFTEAISFVINCETQEEVDYYWEKLSAVPESEQCGWLKDKYGVSWQVVPTVLNDLFRGGDNKQSERVMKAMLQMKKLDISLLKKAFDESS